MFVDGTATVTAEAFYGLDEVAKHVERTYRAGSWVEILDDGHGFDDDVYRAWVPERIERDFHQASIYNRDLAQAAGYFDAISYAAAAGGPGTGREPETSVGRERTGRTGSGNRSADSERALLPGQHLEDPLRAPAELAAGSTAHLGQDAGAGAQAWNRPLPRTHPCRLPGRSPAVPYSAAGSLLHPHPELLELPGHSALPWRGPALDEVPPPAKQDLLAAAERFAQLDPVGL